MAASSPGAESVALMLLAAGAAAAAVVWVVKDFKTSKQAPEPAPRDYYARRPARPHRTSRA